MASSQEPPDSTYFQYLPPPTSSGRPGTSSGKRPGTANPFRHLVDQQAEEAAGAKSHGPSSSQAAPSQVFATSSTAQGDAGFPPPTYGSSRNPYSSYSYEETGRPPRSSYGFSRPPGSSFGYGGGGASSSYGAPGGVSFARYPESDGRHPQEEEDEEEEESDDDDVFAFLPPTTAEVQEERRRKEEDEKRRVQEEAERQRVGVGGHKPQQGGGGVGGSGVERHLGLLGAAGLNGQRQPQVGGSSSIPSGMRRISDEEREDEEDRKRAREEHSFAFTVGRDDVAATSQQQQRRSRSRSRSRSKSPQQSPQRIHAAAGRREKEYPLTADSEDYGQSSAGGTRAGQGGFDAYLPPVSPPSTDSRSGLDTRDGFRMTRLDSRKSEEQERRKSGELERERKPSQVHSEKEDESVTVAASVDGAAKDTAKDSSVGGKTKEAQPDPEDQTTGPGGAYPKHWQHFQPNPAKYNSNSGPYKRHREYHYNQAYPQYKNASSRGGETEESGLPPVIPVASGSRRRRRSHKVPPGTATTAVTATSGSDYLGGSEYTETHNHSTSVHTRPDTGINTLGYLREGGSRSELDEYEEDDYDAESREGSIK